MFVPGNQNKQNIGLSLDQVASRGSSLFYWVNLPALESSGLPLIKSPPFLFYCWYQEIKKVEYVWFLAYYFF
ncbi:hypothetical protein BC941DRAFT_442775 [Chlamydoabsidia padenii]|nr:hypothetical protein BC941DRAFT_442775 [Chlamydoabsidia padenii]